MDAKGDGRTGIGIGTSRPLPYRWGYFQGVVIIPFSLLLLLGTAADLIKPRHDPWYLAIVVSLMGLVGLPLGIGLLRRKRFALTLVYLMVVLALLQVAIQLPIAVTHFADQSDKGALSSKRRCCSSGCYPWFITGKGGISSPEDADGKPAFLSPAAATRPTTAMACPAQGVLSVIAI